jgi:hypothetical protein
MAKLSRNCGTLSLRESPIIMQSNSKDKRKKPYFSPKLTALTAEQASKFVADRTSGRQKEAAVFLRSLRLQNHA